MHNDAPSQSPSAVSLHDVSKHFRVRVRQRRFRFLKGLRPHTRILKALDQVNLEVAKSEMLGVIGMNGSGKSTLLKIISGITPPTTGSAEVRGQIGSLIEIGAGFHPELSGFENVYLNGTILGISRGAIDDRMGDIVEFAGLEGFMDMPVKHFSSGMYMRLGFAIAMQMEPEVLLLDETMSVGDADFQARAMKAIRDYRGTDGKGATILMVSHDIFTIREHCDRVLWLHEGRVRRLGEAGEVVDEYRDYLTQMAGKNAHELMARHGNDLYCEPLAEDSPLAITSLEVLDDQGLPAQRLNHPKRVTLAVHWRAARPLPDTRLCVAMVRTDNESVTLEQDSQRSEKDFGCLKGEGTIRFSFDASQFYSDDFRFIAAFYDPENPMQVWARETADFELVGIPQRTPESYFYLVDPCGSFKHVAATP